MKHGTHFKKIDFFILSFIIIISLIFRLYKINTPLADHHSWRQVDTSSVARHFVKNGFDLLRPRYHDLSNIQSGLTNPHGYRMVEFPLYNGLFGFVYKILPVLSLEVYGRLTTILFSLVIIALIYFLALWEEGRLAACIASLLYGIFPFFVFYSRVVLPDMTAVAFLFVSIFFLYRHTFKNTSSVVLVFLSALFFALSLLVKPTTIFFSLTLAYLLYKKHAIAIFKKAYAYIYWIIAFVPFFAWRWWIQQFKEGVPFSEWLFTSVNTFEGRKMIFFKPAFFRWVFEERILLLILGGYMVVFFILGILKKQKGGLISFIGLSSLIYLLVFQGGNVQHDYYQIIILPSLALFVGKGVTYFLTEKERMVVLPIRIAVVVGIFVFSFFSSFLRVKDFYAYSNDQIKIATIIKTVTSEDALIITDTTGDTTLLYLSDRKGYPATTHPLDELQKRGLQYFVTMKKDVADQVRMTYPLIFENDKVFIFKL